MINPEKCCGCGACESICGKGAITLCPNEQGFLAPKIDNKLCVDCGLCGKVCPEQNDSTLRAEKAVYALKAPKKIRRESQSGGAFALLAESVLKNNGIVYGAGFDSDLSVRYFRVDSTKELSNLKRSKYVQANNREMYKQVYNDLEAGKEVLYSGTPCYVAGLYNFLNAKKCSLDNLYTIDLVCHGVPSPRLYKEYLELESKKANKQAVSFVFRDKKLYLNELCSKIIWDNSNATIVNGYLRLFHSRLGHRTSCHNCRFSAPNRVGDVTLGDFWGIEEVNARFDEHDGVSLVIVNSENGARMVDRILTDSEYLPSNKEAAIKKQPKLQKPSGKAENYEQFWEVYASAGLEKALIEFCDYNTVCNVKLKNGHIRTRNIKYIFAHLKGKIKNGIPYPVVSVIKKILRH